MLDSKLYDSENVTEGGTSTFRLGILMPELWRMDVWFYMSLGDADMKHQRVATAHALDLDRSG